MYAKFMTRRQALKSIGLGTAALAQGQSVRAASTRNDRPNILFIVSEDNGQELSCYGDPNVRTPHLDSLAKEGVMFRDAYVTQAVCSPSRSTFFTGLYPHQNGQLGLATHQYAMFKDFGTGYQRLKKAGYTTGMLGKTHVNPEEYVEKWIDYRAIKGANFAKKNLGEYTEHARMFIEHAGDKPFFLTVNYPDTHWPLQNQVQGRPRHPLSPGEVKPMPFIGVDNARIRKHIAGYYNCMQRLDECVGELLAVLKNSGKLDSTLIVYIGDHGAQMARGKVGVWEGSTRIPFIVRWKGVAKAGTVSEALVSTIDLLPTFLDAADLPVPGHLPGKSLRPLLRWQAETKDPLADPALLKKLTDEHDALSGTNRRSTEGGWKYLRYLHPDRF